MLSKLDMQQLQSENELLKLQLEDINDMINIREEEVGILRKKAAYTVLLQSTLDGNLEQITQMQNLIGEQQRKFAGSVKRESAMEDEIIQSIEMEKAFYTIKEKYLREALVNQGLLKQQQKLLLHLQKKLLLKKQNNCPVF